MLFELDSLLNWCRSKIEISSLYLSSHFTKLGLGLNPIFKNKATLKQMSDFHQKIKEINLLILQLPQTVIVNFAMGAKSLSAELFMTADLKLLDARGSVEFNHLNQGMTPCSGGLSLLSSLVGHAMARNLLLSTSPSRAGDLKNCGYIHSTNISVDYIQGLLLNIYKQSQIARIQTKLALYEEIKPKIETLFSLEHSIGKAALMAEDWKSENSSASHDFQEAKPFSEKIKLQLIKSDNFDESNVPN